MLSLSRSVGLITGASIMSAVFALASATIDITTARPEAVATGMRITFAVAAILIVVALAIAVGTYRRTLSTVSVGGPARLTNVAMVYAKLLNHAHDRSMSAETI